MEIIIPSKNIYSINIDPVIDNNIDKVEVQSNQIKQTEDYNDLVYYEQINIENIITESLSSDIKSASTFATGDNYWGFACFVKCDDKKYVEKQIYIPKNSNNKTIKSINTGIDSNGNTKIEYTLWGTTIKGTATGNFPYSFDSSGILKVTEGSVTKSNGTLTEGYFNIPDKLENEKQDSDFNINFASGTTILAKALLQIDNGTVGSAKTELVTIDNIEYYKLKLKILCNATIYIMQSTKYGIYNGKSTSGTATLAGEYTSYVGNRIDISIYGKTIGIDLQENIVTIGDGNKTFAFDGNELIQTTNTPTIENEYQEVLSKWKNGKQTANIACSISDYYEENGKLIKSVSNKAQLFVKCIDVHRVLHVETGTFVPVNVEFEVGDSFYITYLDFPPLEDNYKVIITEQEMTNKSFSLTNPSLNSPFKVGKIYGAYTDYRLTTPFTKDISLPFVFYIGDIVIPYTYTNRGDEPISYNRDLTPKKFKVVGTSISKKQGVSQELTLQEV